MAKRGTLYTWIVLHHPKEQRDQAGNDITGKTTLIAGPKDVVASDPKTVGTIASRAIPAEYEDRLDECEILVRPFS